MNEYKTKHNHIAIYQDRLPIESEMQELERIAFYAMTGEDVENTLDSIDVELGDRYRQLCESGEDIDEVLR